MNTIKHRLMILMMLSSFGLLISLTLFARYSRIYRISFLTTIMLLGFSLHDYILLTYGKGEKCETIRLLHGNINALELQDIIEKFRRETGIIPEFINKNHFR